MNTSRILLVRLLGRLLYSDNPTFNFRVAHHLGVIWKVRKGHRSRQEFRGIGLNEDVCLALRQKAGNYQLSGPENLPSGLVIVALAAFAAPFVLVARRGKKSMHFPIDQSLPGDLPRRIDSCGRLEHPWRALRNQVI